MLTTPPKEILRSRYIPLRQRAATAGSMVPVNVLLAWQPRTSGGVPDFHVPIWNLHALPLAKAIRLGSMSRTVQKILIINLSLGLTRQLACGSSGSRAGRQQHSHECRDSVGLIEPTRAVVSSPNGRVARSGGSAAVRHTVVIGKKLVAWPKH